MADGDDPNVELLSGYMTKLGKVRKSWKRRWFVLTEKSLTYYTNENQTKWKGTLWAASLEYVRDSDKRDLCLEVGTTGRIHYFQCDTDIDYGNWKIQLEDLMERTGGGSGGGGGGGEDNHSLSDSDDTTDDVVVNARS